MASEYMEAEVSDPNCAVDSMDQDTEQPTESIKESQLWNSGPIGSNACSTTTSFDKSCLDRKNEVFSCISSMDKDKPRQSVPSSGTWPIRSPRPMKVPLSCSSHMRFPKYTPHSNGTSQRSDAEEKVQVNCESKQSSFFTERSPASAFTSNFFVHHEEPTTSCVDQRDNNLLKRCNSAPVLNDKPQERHTAWNTQQAIPKNTGRIRRFSATVVSLNASPASGSRSCSRLRLHQLKKEESLEGIQNKETEHEREVQATIQISSNCGDLSLSDRRRSLDGHSGSSFSPRSRLSPSTLPLSRSCFSTPSSSATRSCHSRAIDFSSQSVPHSIGSSSPSTPSYHVIPPSSGIPSPLTFSSSLSLFSSSPLPPSPTRSMCGPGKQCFSPSMQVPVSLARASSRSPSPSPTRRAFVTRRRSQSPCIMRPSVLGSIKRKCDSDNEGSSSPKRIFAPNLAKSFSNVATDASRTTSHLTVQPKVTVHRSHRQYPFMIRYNALRMHKILKHVPTTQSTTVVDFVRRNMQDNAGLNEAPVEKAPSDVALTEKPTLRSFDSLSSSSLDSSDLNVTPSPPCSTLFSSQQHIMPAALPQLHSSFHSQSNSLPQTLHTQDQHNRPSSPASSTCSSSSLEGLRDLQPLISPGQVPLPLPNKNVLKTSDDGPAVNNSTAS